MFNFNISGVKALQNQLLYKYVALSDSNPTLFHILLDHPPLIEGLLPDPAHLVCLRWGIDRDQQIIQDGHQVLKSLILEVRLLDKDRREKLVNTELNSKLN